LEVVGHLIAGVVRGVRLCLADGLLLSAAVEDDLGVRLSAGSLVDDLGVRLSSGSLDDNRGVRLSSGSLGDDDDDDDDDVLGSAVPGLPGMLV
jgi:hypothetical protein